MEDNNLRKLQLAELELLKKLLPVMEEHGLQYYALGGTMLGAVRHGGFIPWDDDIDIGLPREDFDILVNIMEKDDGFRFRSPFSDSGYYEYIPRIEDSRVIATDDSTGKLRSRPAWIDIFPLDGVPDNPVLRRIHAGAILYRRMLFKIARFDRMVAVSKKDRPLHERIIIALARHPSFRNLFAEEKTLRKLDRTLHRYSFKGNAYVINAMGAWKLREMMPKSIFGNARSYAFEDIEIRGAENADDYLTSLYGDWRKPPEGADLNHHFIRSIDIDDGQKGS